MTQATNPTGEAKEVSVVIPIYNEAIILRASVTELVQKLRESGRTFDIVLAENGSTDGTVEVIQELSKEFPEVQSLHINEPNYGRALKLGILQAKGHIVICEEIDLCDVDFHQRALEILNKDPNINFVVGSKALPKSQDERPLSRRMATRVITLLLRLCVGFRGTDTHGLKAFRRKNILPFVKDCTVEHDIFASELVIRAEHGGAGVMEIPVAINEKRAPSIHLMERVPRALNNLMRLTIAIRFNKKT